MADAIPFADDTDDSAYDVEAARSFFVSLIHANRVLSEFRSTFTAKPVRCTSSGEGSISRRPDSRAVLPRCTRPGSHCPE